MQTWLRIKYILNFVQYFKCQIFCKATEFCVIEIVDIDIILKLTMQQS